MKLLFNSALVVGILAFVVGFYPIRHDSRFYTQSNETWENWGLNVNCTPRYVHMPSSVQEVVQIVKDAKQKGEKIRVVGAGHSWAPIVPVTGHNGHLISLDNLSSLLSVDKEKHTITAQAGMRLRAFNEIAQENGLTLPNMGHIDQQSIGGVIATGTHGSGKKFGSLSTFVIGMEVVTANGDILKISQTENSDLLPAYSLHLGVFGIVVSVTFQCETSFIGRRREFPIAVADLKTQIPVLLKQHDYFQVLAYPNLPYAKVSTVERHKAETSAEYTIVQAEVQKVAVTAVMRQMTEETLNYADHSFNALTGGYPDHYYEMEQFFTVENGLKALDDLHRLWRDHPELEPNFAIPLRFVAKDDLWLSNQYQTDTMVVSVCIYRNEALMDAFFKEFTKIAIKYEARPHWGKINHANREYLQRVYPRFGDFAAARKRADPDGMFLNEYLASIFE